MHLFVSDLHLTDWDYGGVVSDHELLRITNVLSQTRSDEPHTLVLLGDIVDLLRSSQWNTLWEEHQSAPWSGMARDFTGFRFGYARDCAIGIAKNAVARYPKFCSVLERLVRQDRVRVVYVPGNHGFMVQLSSTLRGVLKKAFSLSHDARNPFRSSYNNRGASVYATHGNFCDSLNWHNKDEGYWAFGDAIVLRLVDRFVTEGPRALGVKDTWPSIYDLDNVEPVTDIPVFVRWVAEHLTNLTQKTPY